MDELHLEAARLDGLAGLVRHQLHDVGEAVLLQLQPDQAVGEGCAVDRGVGGLEDIGDGADVVLMAVGDEVAPQLLLVVD